LALGARTFIHSGRRGRSATGSEVFTPPVYGYPGGMPLAVLVTGVLWGSVTIGPTTPVCQAGVPCSGAAKQATLTFSRPGRVVSTKTDDEGRYRIRLAVGAWTVRASVGMRTTPTSIRVRAGTRRANFSVDTGIR
jgi:hypothetical protein